MQIVITQWIRQFYVVWLEAYVHGRKRQEGFYYMQLMRLQWIVWWHKNRETPNINPPNPNTHGLDLDPKYGSYSGLSLDHHLGYISGWIQDINLIP